MRRCLLVQVFLSALVLAATAVVAAPPPPEYARLALPPNGARVLPLMIKCSGSPRIHDVVFADTNFNGRYEASEKHVARAPKRSDRSDSGYSASFEIPRQSGKAASLACSLTYHTFSGDPAYTSYSLIYKLPGARAMNTVYGTFRSAPAPQRPPLLGAAGPPKLRVEVKPDEAKPGQTGFGVTLGWLAAPIYLANEPSVHLVARSDSGAIAVDTTKPLKSLGFG